jgi:CarD family transcriptional regulator
MSFKVGDTVVYPHHGAARIEEIETRSIKGEDRTYLVLKVDKGDLTVRVPADNAELVGVRDVVGQEGLERVSCAVHRRADQLVPAVQGQPGETSLG